MDNIIIVIFGTLATVGFAIMFNAKPKRILWAVIGGLLASLIYVYTSTLGVFASNIIGGVVVTLYSEIFSRILKCPVVALLTPSVIPLVPGGLLYYTLFYIMQKDYTLASSKALDTLYVCLGIAVGILAASLAVSLFFMFKKKIDEKNKNRKEKCNI